MRVCRANAQRRDGSVADEAETVGDARDLSAVGGIEVGQVALQVSRMASGLPSGVDTVMGQRTRGLGIHPIARPWSAVPTMPTITRLLHRRSISTSPARRTTLAIRANSADDMFGS